MSLIYSIDTTKEITPEMVKGALVSCFYDAHCNQTEISDLTEKVDETSNRLYCTQIISQAFEETNGDFDNPTKESILKTLPWLANFSKNFRDQETIQKHMQEIQKLINLI